MNYESIQKSVFKDLEQVNKLIKSSLKSNILLIEEVSKHIVGAPSKRIRPLLVIIIGKMLRIPTKKIHQLALIIEFIHTATLLHDDVVDTSEKRRGKKSANKIWGNEASVLVGDYLYSRSFQMMVKLGDKKIIPIDDTGRVIIYPALQGELSKERINLLTVPTIELDEKKRSLLKNNVLLIGNDQDSANIKNIPFRQNSIISNAELMALAISTIQSELYISELTKNTEVFVWIVLIFLGVLIFKYYPKKAISRIGLLILIYLSFNMVLFQSNGQWISPLPPLVLFVLMTVFAFFLPQKKAS